MRGGMNEPNLNFSLKTTNLNFMVAGKSGIIRIQWVRTMNVCTKIWMAVQPVVEIYLSLEQSWRLTDIAMEPLHPLWL